MDWPKKIFVGFCLYGSLATIACGYILFVLTGYLFIGEYRGLLSAIFTKSSGPIEVVVGVCLFVPVTGLMIAYCGMIVAGPFLAPFIYKQIRYLFLEDDI